MCIRDRILTAVLEKYSKINLQNQDIFVNVVGGIRLREPATDLAVLPVSYTHLRAHETVLDLVCRLLLEKKQKKKKKKKKNNKKQRDTY